MGICICFSKSVSLSVFEGSLADADTDREANQNASFAPSSGLDRACRNMCAHCLGSPSLDERTPRLGAPAPRRARRGAACSPFPLQHTPLPRCSRRSRGRSPRPFAEPTFRTTKPPPKQGGGVSGRRTKIERQPLTGTTTDVGGRTRHAAAPPPRGRSQIRAGTLGSSEASSHNSLLVLRVIEKVLHNVPHIPGSKRSGTQDRSGWT